MNTLRSILLVAFGYAVCAAVAVALILIAMRPAPPAEASKRLDFQGLNQTVEQPPHNLEIEDQPELPEPKPADKRPVLLSEQFPHLYGKAKPPPPITPPPMREAEPQLPVFPQTVPPQMEGQGNGQNSGCGCKRVFPPPPVSAQPEPQPTPQF